METPMEPGQAGTHPPATGTVLVRGVREVMTVRPHTVRETDDLALVRQMMLWTGVRHFPVVRDGMVSGVLSERELLVCAAERGADEARKALAREVMRTDLPTVSPEDPSDRAAEIMATSKADGLAVVERGMLVGIVTATDLLFERAAPRPVRSGPLARLRARDVMTPDPALTSPESRLLDAVALMAELEIRHLPVIDATGRLVGIISDRDVRAAIGDPLEAVREDREENDDLIVRDVMSEQPVRVRVDDPLEELAHVFSDERVGAVPVVDEGDHPVGIVSYVDLVALIPRQTQPEP